VGGGGGGGRFCGLRGPGFDGRRGSKLAGAGGVLILLQPDGDEKDRKGRQQVRRFRPLPAPRIQGSTTGAGYE